MERQPSRENLQLKFKKSPERKSPELKSTRKPLMKGLSKSLSFKKKVVISPTPNSNKSPSKQFYNKLYNLCEKVYMLHEMIKPIAVRTSKNSRNFKESLKSPPQTI